MYSGKTGELILQYPGNTGELIVQYTGKTDKQVLQLHWFSAPHLHNITEHR